MQSLILLSTGLVAFSFIGMEVFSKKGVQMKPYKVRFENEDGKEVSQDFDTMEEAQQLYDSLNGAAVIQKWVEEWQRYDDVVFQIFEF